MTKFLAYHLTLVMKLVSTPSFAGDVVDFRLPMPKPRAVVARAIPPDAEYKSLAGGIDKLLKQLTLRVNRLESCTFSLDGPNSWKIPTGDFYTAAQNDESVRHNLLILKSTLKEAQLELLDQIISRVHLGPLNSDFQAAVRNMHNDLQSNQQGLLRRLLNSIFRQI